jgi:hypothetical protein
LSTTPHRAFVVELRAEPGVDGIRSLRALLKVALRRYGLRAIDIHESSTAPTQENPMSAFSERIRNSTRGFLKVSDLEGGKEVTHTISHLDEEMEMFGKTLDILNFSDTGKQLSLNQTNAEWLLDNFGDDPEKWAGQAVTLYLGEYEYNKEKKLGIRLRLPGTKPAVKEGTILPPQGDGAVKNPRVRPAARPTWTTRFLSDPSLPPALRPRHRHLS